MAYLNPAAGAARASAHATEVDTLLTAIPVEAVADLAATTNITTVPASFADLAAVQTYLAATAVVPNIETRLDGAEAKINAALAVLRTAGILAAA